MSVSFDFGREAENFAAEYLNRLGYKILARNFFYQKAEIDIIAEKDNLLVIFEVKARGDNALILPEKSVTTKKKKLLITAADYFVSINNLNVEIRFDILALIKRSNGWNINHIQDAFNAFEL